MPRSTLSALGLAVAAAVVVPPGLAHDWPSPTPPSARRSGPEQVPGPSSAPWPGLLWAGPQAGMPAAPSARDCDRPPRRFVLDDGQPRWSRPGPPMSSERADRAVPARLGAGRAEAERATASTPTLAPSLAPAPSAPPAAAPAAGKALQRPQPASEPVTAGVVDDNADFGAYRAFRQRHARLPQRPWLLDDRVRLDVRDATGRPVPDAQVEVFSRGLREPLAARTDAAGRAWLMPQADVQAHQLDVRVSRGGAVQTVRWQRGQRDALQVRLDTAEAMRARLDLVFAIDATGSMADEIDKLKRSMREVAERIAALPQAPDLCLGLVAYRDRGDAFFVRGADLTNDLSAFQAELGALQAEGGGDYPEAMAEALHTAVHRLSWRGEGTARLVVLLADAPPQRRPEGPFIDHEARAALARGIKVFSVAASGLDREGELALRMAAQASGGRFVFLTYAQRHDPASGPGRETAHDVQDYSVETLDKLVVRLVAEELAAWPAP